MWHRHSCLCLLSREGCRHRQECLCHKSKMPGALKESVNTKDKTVIAFFLRRKGVTALVLAGFLLLAVAAVALRRTSAPKLPTAEVQRGEFVDYVQVRGEIRLVTVPPCK